jgi:hypothetical protein
MAPQRPSRLGVALLLSALVPGLGSLVVGQPLLGLTLIAATAASLLATLLFYGYVTTPLVWVLGLLVAAVGARRRAAGHPPWPRRRVRWFLGWVSLAAAGLVVFHLAWSAPMAPGTALRSRAGPPAGPPMGTVTWHAPAGPRTIDPSAAPGLSVNELGHLRWWMAIATQPTGEWEGFYRLEPFGQTALRYQLAFAAYALAQAQVTKLPAYRSPINGALEDLVEKMLHPAVWGYWKWESFAQAGRWREDPVAEGNVMYSGHLASMAGLARLLADRPLHDAPGSLAFASGEHPVASYSYRSLLERLASQFRTNPGHVITCEPHQAFVMCNNHAALALVLGSRLLDDKALEAAVPLYTKAYGELFRAGDAEPTLRYPHYTTLGRTLPFHLMLGDGWAIATLNGLLPDEARRLYAVYRRRLFGAADDGNAGLAPAPFYERVDLGNMRMSEASHAAFALLAAREMGDDTVARELLATIESRYRPRWRGGRRTYKDLSPLLHAVTLLARTTPPGGLKTLFTEAQPARAWRGPHVRSVEGGAMDVIQAAYDPEAEALLVGLVAGRSTKRRTVVMAGLDPARRYTLVVNGRVAASGRIASPDGTLRVPVGGAIPVRCVLAAHPPRP